MILSIVCALICFVCAIVMFSSYYRKITLLRPIAVYLIYIGVWECISFIISDLYPTSRVPYYALSIGTIVIVSYYIFMLIMTKSKSRRKSRRTQNKN